MWVPDTYEAAATPFVAWLSVAPKAAGFAVVLRVFIEHVGPPAGLWAGAAALLGALTIVAGNLMAIPQTDAKRLLAYSGIAHIGYMLLGIAALSPEGVAMLLFYLVAYLFSNMGAFMVVEAVARAEGSSSLRTFRGLAQRSPVLALAMLLFLLSLGGIPFVVGFWAKLYVLWAAAQAGLYGLVLLAAVLTVVALFYYLWSRSRCTSTRRRGRRRCPSARRSTWCSWSARWRWCCSGSIPDRWSTPRCGRPRRCSDGRPAGSLLPAALHVDPALRRLLVASRDPGALRLDPAPGHPRPAAALPGPVARDPHELRSRRRRRLLAPGPAAAAPGPGRTPTAARGRGSTRARRTALPCDIAIPVILVVLLVYSDGPGPGLIQPRPAKQGRPPPVKLGRPRRTMAADIDAARQP